ncbi:putative conserved membrane protein [Aspergillus clavatus NRRL 1]|uniref:DSC E3 ubiquitin ligase complex subunit C n=1 Tax=Aspergillus clavatus (strain ATCC 1007 / CBS 513.65 / DSM 816 / NCTC 3887 / NRRL 1 / QM 1276 / 107) TaxID=344612 RepID=A1CI10_ASPCL|nr:conserved membrane protein, putative [Aspergillus clavatus NRRL 1]EAW10515.1 conserved membrane protein, putative [Aspergillus clavatus NRRL 1]
MSLYKVAMHSPVTSSATMLRCASKPFNTRCAQAARSFSSLGSTYRSSKRDMQTATAYRPHTLPASFPPLSRSAGTPDTSIAAEFPPMSNTTLNKQDRNGSFSNVSLREQEAQKSRPAATPSLTGSKSAEKPRRKLRARKAAMKLTPIAVEQLHKLLSQPDPKFIRVGVKNRGCSGLAYHLEYVDKPGAFDEVVEQDGVKVLIDSKALFSIIGSEMDWQEDKLSRKFIFRNPNISIQATMTSPSFLTPDSILDRDTAAEPLFLTIRFSASIPDLPLDVLSPDVTTAAGLKQLIRTRLPRDLSSHRLRLIYAGRGLEDATPLSASLKLPPSPSRTPIPQEDVAAAKGKGKAPVREQPRLYVHCSIGDIVLSDADLAAEAAIATTLQQEQGQEQEQPDDFSFSKKGKQHQRQPSPLRSTTSAPRGFDRLLSAGFTPAEVSALRSQFMAIQSVSRTPDTMPTGAELRELEDRWMDEGSTSMGAGLGGGGEGASFADDDGGFGAGSRGAMDDMLWGAVMGFFWPVGCAMWLRREEGVWSWRKGLAVFVGVVVNVAFGAMRIMN